MTRHPMSKVLNLALPSAGGFAVEALGPSLLCMPERNEDFVHMFQTLPATVRSADGHHMTHHTTQSPKGDGPDARTYCLRLLLLVVGI